MGPRTLFLLPGCIRKNMKSLKKCIVPAAVRVVDLASPLEAIDDVSKYSACEVFVLHSERLLGKARIENAHRPISPAHLRDAIANQMWWQIAKRIDGISFDPLEDALVATTPTLASEEPSLPVDVAVSVVIATYDRPEQLRVCLESLASQSSSRSIEAVIVDNHPPSEMTPAVVAEFPGTVLVAEPRQGLAYARNAGFIRSSGDIVITTDDDVTMPPDWLERLIAPFNRTDVAVVTGNVLPRELETRAQCLFEEYGGLGRGFEKMEADLDWFRRRKRRAAPTWQLGATANAAFRANIFRNPLIGLMDEALGPGMPSGVGEDTYLFYKTIKAGFTLVYEPQAFVWHTHRRDMGALRRQIYNYSKGHVAYHLTTLLNDGDRRAIFRLLFELPKSYLKRAKLRLGGHSAYPISLILLELIGNCAGPFGLWRSRRRVGRTGRSKFPDIGHIEHSATE